MPKIKVTTLNYYKVLEVNANADEREIRQAYKRLALKWHPDKNRGNSNKTAELKFKEIAEAYEVLSDKNKRFEYDNRGRQYKYENEENEWEEDGEDEWEDDDEDESEEEEDEWEVYEENEWEEKMQEKEQRERIVREKREKEINQQAEHRMSLHDVRCYCDEPAIKRQTQKENENYGRFFYCCSQQATCNYFVWEDEYQVKAKCYCGEYAIKRKVKKDNMNHGRFFYCCADYQDKCDYFMWEDEFQSVFKCFCMEYAVKRR
ncbi:1980_t:CDS:1, partial [Dentiscutata heterogama]